MRKKPVLAIVVPCFNEREVLLDTAQRLFAVLNRLKKQDKVYAGSFILFIDDGSDDNTWHLIQKIQQQYKHVLGIKLSGNFGHQNALLAGLMKVRNISDCAISIDGDLQQDERAIPEFLSKYQEGCDIVYGVRKSRKSDSVFKRFTAEFFYNIMHIMGVRMIKNHADYRLVTSKVLAALAEHKECTLFLRGIFPLLGFKSTIVYHEVKPRYAGYSKYSTRKMISFALKGIVSFSFSPIRYVSLAGLFILITSMAGFAYLLMEYFAGDFAGGLGTVLLLVYFLSGIQLISLGVIGEYIGKIYTEVKQKPKYIIEEEI